MSEDRESLAPQLGTDPVDISEGRVDMRRLAIIDRRKVSAVMYAAIRARTSPTWKAVLDWYLNTTPAIGGRGRRDIIRMEQVSRGGSVDLKDEIDSAKPDSWLERNLTRRNWKEEEMARIMSKEE